MQAAVIARACVCSLVAEMSERHPPLLLWRFAACVRFAFPVFLLCFFQTESQTRGGRALRLAPSHEATLALAPEQEIFLALAAWRGGNRVDAARGRAWRDGMRWMRHEQRRYRRGLVVCDTARRRALPVRSSWRRGVAHSRHGWRMQRRRYGRRMRVRLSDSGQLSVMLLSRMNGSEFRQVKDDDGAISI